MDLRRISGEGLEVEVAFVAEGAGVAEDAGDQGEEDAEVEADADGGLLCGEEGEEGADKGGA